MHFDNYSIRLLEAKDAEPFYNLIEINRSRLEDFFSGTVAKNKTLEDSRQYVVAVMEKIAGRIYLPHVIEEQNSKKLVGFIDLKNIDWNIPKGELGCFVDKEYEGKGIATKTLSVFTDYCFKELGFKKLFLRTHEKNSGSRRAAEKNGFKVEGIIRMDYKTTKGKIVDLMYYGLVKE